MLTTPNRNSTMLTLGTLIPDPRETQMPTLGGGCWLQQQRTILAEQSEEWIVEDETKVGMAGSVCMTSGRYRALVFIPSERGQEI